MDEPLAYLNGQFLPVSQLQISADDLGFTMGVSVSERLRTFNGRLFHVRDHLRRLANSLDVVGISTDHPEGMLEDLLDFLVSRNQAGLNTHDDLGLALFVTPGPPHVQRSTVGIQVYPLPFGQWADYYERGQQLALTSIRQIPSTCWPPELKCRSRMHYYLADREAARCYPDSRAILLDQDGCVSEASTANVLVYRANEGLVSPPLEAILPGVSLSVLAELAQKTGIAFSYRPLTAEDLSQADEILLCSTSPCVWSATHLNGQPIGNGIPGPVYRRLLQAWSELVGFDIAGQARRFRDRV